MLNKKLSILIITGLILMMSVACASAQSIAPDRAQQILDLIAVECQNINDYSVTASYGDTSRYEAVKSHGALPP